MSLTLALAGVERPASMEGRDMFAEGFKRDYVVSARDRCDFFSLSDFDASITSNSPCVMMR